jgi:hypothetical protein
VDTGSPWDRITTLYLHDFIIFCRPDSKKGKWALETALARGRQKTEGPAIILTFLWIEIDTVAEMVCLSTEN